MHDEPGFQAVGDDPEAPAPRRPTLADEHKPTGQRSLRRPAESARKRAAPKKSAAPKAEEKDYAAAVRGIFQLPAAGLIVAGQQSHNTALIADGATLLAHGGNVAQAIADIAEGDPRVAALLDKALAFGPYGALLAAVLPMVAQFATNHGAPHAITQGFGAVTPEQIIGHAGLQVPEPSSNGDQAAQQRATG